MGIDYTNVYDYGDYKSRTSQVLQQPVTSRLRSRRQ